jgi:hypothetical protein
MSREEMERKIKRKADWLAPATTLPFFTPDFFPSFLLSFFLLACHYL